MFGKNLKNLNTKKKIIIFKSTKNYLSQIIFVTEYYSMFKIYAKKNFFFRLKEKGFFYFLDKSNNNFYTAKQFYYRAKNDNTVIGLNHGDSVYVFFQKKIKKISIVEIKLSKENYINSSFKFNLNVRNKYWGQIVNLFSNSKGAAKIIIMKKNSQSSMEFHINKLESYYISSGHIDLGIRYGRARNSIIKLKKNNTFFMKPGTMHMRMSKSNSKILEMCTKDYDNDSIIVHDGKNYKFKTSARNK
jgi:mannose-6-phosphate isomerase-like protein (cupin superfamily)